MSEIERRMIEDRTLRDAALALVKADVAHLQADLNARSVGTRLLDRVTERASDVLDEASNLAKDNHGVLLALLAAVVLWFSRNPLIALFSGRDDGDDAEPDDAELDDAEPEDA